MMTQPASIVVIDDKDVNLRLMRACLQAEPYEVTTFTDPRQALDHVRRTPPDLVLLDLMMPVMDGFAVLEVLRTVAPQVPVLVITGLEDREAMLRALAAGARDYLTKPVDRSELLLRVRNMVALKQAVDALGHALRQLEEANRDLNAFAGGLAHDLQQPITSIAAFAQVIERHTAGTLPASDAGHLKRIIAAAGSAQRMIRGLLEFARLGRRDVERRPVELGAVVQEARNALAHEPDAQRAAWQVGPLPVVQGDAALLLFVFINLLSNALKYSRNQAQPAVAIGAQELPGGGFAVHVQDNGVGFDMAQAQRLFHPFERLHSTSEFEGTGMGLANVRRIMERHGGAIRAEAAPGRGATFTLVFAG
jgi:two-component system sensor histidine kinase/response regulator